MIATLCSVFFLSGASALVFESLWFQLLGISVGNSVFASTIVLSAFMAGLAIGNGLAIALGNRVTNPVKLYAYLEAAIAFAGLSVVVFLPKMTSLWVPVFQIFLKQPIVLNLLRATISFVLLILPATAMGATLPILVKVLLKKIPNFGHVLGMLYGWNTLGAVCGVMANELMFVRTLGLTGAGILAAGINILVASVVLVLYGQTTGGQAVQSAKIPWPEIRTFYEYRHLAASFITGLLILALEVIWFRFMLLFFNAYTLNFALMLATVLSGIGLGGLAASKWFKKQPNAQRYLFLLFIAEGLLLPILYRYFYPLLEMFGIAGVSFEKESLVFLSMILILPVTFLSGIIFTMLGKALEARLKEGTTATGILTMANTTGGMLGAMLAGLVLIPKLGIESTFLMCAFTFGLMALLFFDKALIGKSRRAAAASIVLTLIIIVWIFPYGIMQKKYLNYTIRSRSNQGLRRIAVKESPTETIQLLQKDFLGKPHYHRLMTNAHSMSTTSLMSKRYTKLYVYLPVALMDSPKDALLICYGSGATAKALTDTRSFEHIDIVDTSKDIFEMSNLIYGNSAANPLNDPRVKKHTEDGRFFLLTTENTYDLITAEPPPPQFKGIVNLYTKEYFQLLYDRLKPGGMVTYWLPVHHMQVSASQSIIKGFSEVFENCSLWLGSGYNWMLVGVKDMAKKATATAFSEQWENPVTAKEMRALGFIEPEQLGSLFIADGKRLRNWISESTALVDNYPYRLYDGGTYLPNKRSLMEYDRFESFQASLENFKNSEFIKALWPDEMLAGAERYFAVRDVINASAGRWSGHIDRVSLHHLHGIIEASLPGPYVLWAFNLDVSARQIFEERFQKTSESYEVQAYQHLFWSIDALMEKDFGKAEQHLDTAAAILKSSNSNISRNLQLYLFYLFWRTGEKEKSKEAALRYIAPTLPGKDRRIREIKSNLRWLQQNFHGTG